MGDSSWHAGRRAEACVPGTAVARSAAVPQAKRATQARVLRADRSWHEQRKQGADSSYLTYHHALGGKDASKNTHILYLTENKFI